MKVLYVSPKNISFNYFEKGKGAFIQIIDRNANCSLHTYSFPKVELYKHQYLSWHNLDCCGEWIFDHDYLKYHAVQENKKLVADIVFINEYNSVFLIDDVIESCRFDLSKVNCRFLSSKGGFNRMYANWLVAKKGSLADFFDLDEILYRYKRLKVGSFDRGKLEQAFSVPIIELYTGYSFSKRHGEHFREFVESIADRESKLALGLCLGYPLEAMQEYL